MGHGLVENWITPEYLNRIPDAAIDSFAGVGCSFPLEAIQHGEKTLDLGNGSGIDASTTALKTGTYSLSKGILKRFP